MPLTTAPTASFPPCDFFWRDGGDPQPNQWTYFRRLLQHDGRGSVIAFFAADPTARLIVNGEVVVARVMRFVRPQITVERVDLTPHLRPGANVIVLLHHHWGVRTFQRSPGGRPGASFVIEGETTKPVWRWRNANEYLAHRHQTIGRGGAERIRFPVVADARNIEAQIHEANYDDAGWREARPVSDACWSAPVLKETPPLDRQRHNATRMVAFGTFEVPKEGTPPFPEVPMSWFMRHGQYSPEPLPTVRDRARVHAWTLTAGNDAYVTYDFGQPLHGYVELTIDAASAGTILDIAHGEFPPRADGSFDPESIVGSPVGDRLILRDGAQRIEIPEERTWRYLILVARGATSPLTVSDVACLTSETAVTIHGSYDGGPDAVSQTVKLCIDHARVTMSDTYVDTPGREDGQWLEDIEYRAALASRWFNDTTLRQVTIRHASEQQDAGGLFRVFAPEDYGDAGVQSLDWGMTWIGLLHDDWMWTGSTGRIERYFSSLERFLSALATRANADGLLTGENTFADIRIAHRANAGRGELESTANAWLHGYLRKAATMADAVGRHEAEARWSAAADRVRVAFERFVRKSDAGTVVTEVWSPKDGAAEKYGQGATVSAAFHSLLDPEIARAALQTHFPAPDGSPPAGVSRWNNPTYAHRVLTMLCEHGFGKVAAAHLAERYAPFLPDGPLPEYFLANAQPDDPTGSHGWAAVPLLWLHETVLGVRIAKPGGQALLWKPVDVGWGRSCGTTMTPRGACEVQIDWEERSFALHGPTDVAIDIALPEHLGTPSAPGATVHDGHWHWTVTGQSFDTKLR